MDESPNLPAATPEPPTDAAAPFVPLSFGETLDRVLQLVRTHWKRFVASSWGAWLLVNLLGAGIYGGILLLLWFHTQQSSGALDPGLTHLLLFVGLLIALPLTIVVVHAMFLFEAQLTQVALDLTASEPAEPRSLWGELFRGRVVALGWLRLLFLGLPLVAVMVLVAGTTALAMAYGHGQMAPGGMFFLFPLWAIGYVGALVYSLWAMISLAFAYPVLLEEDRTAWHSLWRGMRATRGVRGRILLISLVICAISCALFLILELVAVATGGIGMLLIGLLHLPHAVAIVAAVIAGLIVLVFYSVCYILTLAAYVTGFTVLFREQQRRRAALGPMGD